MNGNQNRDLSVIIPLNDLPFRRKDCDIYPECHKPRRKYMRSPSNSLNRFSRKAEGLCRQPTPPSMEENSNGCILIYSFFIWNKNPWKDLLRWQNMIAVTTGQQSLSDLREIPSPCSLIPWKHRLLCRCRQMDDMYHYFIVRCKHLDSYYYIPKFPVRC